LISKFFTPQALLAFVGMIAALLFLQLLANGLLTAGSKPANHEPPPLKAKQTSALAIRGSDGLRQAGGAGGATSKQAMPR
jgi:hypothetical protein